MATNLRIIISASWLLWGCWFAHAQALPTALRSFDLSSSSGITITNAGVSKSRQTGITLGVESVFMASPKWRLGSDFRAMTPLSSTLASESSAAAGLRLSHPARAFTSYCDVLLGRAQMTYAGSGVQVPNTTVFYTQSRSALVEFGGGIAVDITDTLAMHLDQQIERLSLPIASSGHSLAFPMTFGIVYHPPYRNHGHPY